MPDPVPGEKACLCVSLRPGQSLVLADVQRLLDGRQVSKLKWSERPERLEVVAAMPLTPARKVIKGEFAKLLLSK